MPNSKPDVPFEIGDTVRVKEGVEDSDYPGEEIGDWQGRIVDIDDESRFLEVEWDSATLRGMPPSVLREAKLDGLDWTRYWVDPADVSTAEPRDSPQDVRQARREVEEKLRWMYLNEAEEDLIRYVESRTDSNEERDLLATWNDELTNRLSFPFQARIAEPQDDVPFQYGDEVQVKNILLLDSLYGILAVIQRGRGTKHFPLVDLKAIDEDSANRSPLRAYRNWFANH